MGNIFVFLILIKIFCITENCLATQNCVAISENCIADCDMNLNKMVSVKKISLSTNEKYEQFMTPVTKDLKWLPSHVLPVFTAVVFKSFRDW